MIQLRSDLWSDYACFQFDASNKWTCQFFVVVVSQSNRMHIVSLITSIIVECVVVSCRCRIVVESQLWYRLNWPNFPALPRLGWLLPKVNFWKLFEHEFFQVICPSCRRTGIIKALNGSTILNSLPHSVHFCQSLTPFRKHLKTLYFHLAFSAASYRPTTQRLRFNFLIFALYKPTYLLTYM